MKARKWLIILLAIIVTTMSTATYTGVTESLFTDDEHSTDDTLLLFIPQVVLDDGFEGDPWDDNWNDNGATTWIQDSAKPHTGTYNARISNSQTPGYLTSDDLDCAGTSIIYVSFWFNLKSLEAGDCVLQIYNGSAWATWYDLLAYPTYTNNVWCQFSEEIIDSQYFVGNFRIRFDASTLGGTTESADIDDVLLSTFDSTPAAPTGLAATLGDTEVSLDWADNSEGDLDGYNVYRSLTSGSGYAKINGSLVATSDYTDTGLTNDVTYYYVVTAVDFGSNESDYSNEDSATPTDLPPAAPIGLVATSGNEEINLDWNDNSEGDLDGYNVYRSETPGGPYTTPINASLVAASDYTDTGLTYDVTYYYVVRAVDLTSNESGDSNEDSAVANNVAPAAPTGLVATPGDKQVSLNWDDNSEGDFDGYNVYRSLTSGSGYAKINGSLLSTSDYTDTGLTNGVTYYYVLTAVDTYAAESVYSLEDDATPVNAPPAAPTGLAAISDNAEISLDWNDNTETDLDGYNVYRSLTSGSGYSKINGSLVATSDYTDTGLTNNVTYYYVVKAVDTEAAASGYSSEASATPVAPVFLNDGFEGDPWDDNWNNNGTTTWIRDAGSPNSGTYNAMISNSQTPGYLTSDDIDASASTTGITVNFWFKLKSLEAGDCIVEIYNGTTYNTWYDLINYPTYVNNVWCQFSEVLSDSQYFISGFRIRFDASALGGTTESANIDDVLIITDSIPPTAPAGLVATPGDTEVSLDWTDNTESDLDGYNVYRSTTQGSGYVKINGSLVTASDYTDTGLYGGVTTYYYVVTAVDLGTNESGNSDEASATPTDSTPTAPTGLGAVPGDKLVDLDWTDNTEGDIDGYNVYRSLTSGSGYAKINGSLLSTSDYNDTGLTNNTTYYYVVTAVDMGSNESGYSNEVSATPDPPPAAPAGLVATPGDKQVSLNWDDNSEGDLAGYNVYRSETQGSGYVKINGSLVATSDYNDTGLIGGTTYYYVVTAVDLTANESGYSSEASATPTDPPPAAPTGLGATPGDKLVDLDWADNGEGDLNGYNVYRSETQGSGYVKINGSLVATSDYNDTGLVGGTTYYYVVTAVDLVSNESGYSNEASATPTDPPPAAPTGLGATPGDKLVDLDWADNGESDLNGYNVYRSETQGSGYIKINGSLVAASYYQDTGLIGITYYYVVTAVDLASNESGYSSEASATPIDAAPSAPAGLVATPGDRQVSLDWDNNSESDLDGYNVYRSLTSGSGYAKINGSLLSTSDYTDTSTHGGTPYYYVVTAVDLGSNESSYSGEASATPTRPTSLDDGFEGTPWDFNWDENGITTWILDSSKPRTGTYDAEISNTGTPGNLTTDDLDFSTSAGITVNFWFNLKGLEAGDILLQLYNGSTWATWYDLLDYPAYVNNVWCEFNEVIIDTQYHIAGFRLRFNASALGDSTEQANIDDVLIITDSTPPAAPTGLVATPGDEQVSLDWADNGEGDLDGYNVHRSETTGGPYTKINGSLVTNSDYIDSGLYGGGTYYYVVTAVDLSTNESGNSDEASATATDVAPAAPAGLIATPGVGQVSLDWNDNTETDLAGYNVHRSETQGSGYVKINGSLVATSDYTDSGVTELVAYYYVVTAVDNGANESGNSGEASATPDWAPAAPANLVATPGDEQVSLDWDDNSEGDLDGYNVHRSETMGGPYTKINGSLVATSDYTDSGLYGGGTYYYVVTAVDNGANESGNSDEASATATDVAPAAPAGLVATPGDEQVSLDWNDNTEGDLDGYNVYRSLTSGSGYVKINGSLVATSDYLDTGLTNNTTYYYVVTAVDLAANESGYSSEASATPDTPPAAPTGLVATPGDKQVSLDWNDNTEGDLDGYNVHRSETMGGPYTKINGSLVATSDYTDTGLTGGVTYYYVVTAVDLAANESGYSSEANATPTDPPPAAPANLVATPGDKQVSLNWDDNSEGDIDGYNVYRSETQGSGYVKINGSLVTNSDYTDTGLVGGTTYYYVVTAVDLAANESGYSSEANATPTDPPPAAPANLVATPGDKQVSLNWTDNSEGDLAGYNVYRSLTSGSGYAKINGSLVATSDYTDTGLTGGTTYYYVVTAVDLAANESGYSSEANATAASITLLNDGFESTPWDNYWDGNGATDWQLSSAGGGYSGSYSAEHKSGDTYLTSDDLDTSGADSITVSFWFKIKDLNKGPLNVQLYNGTAYSTWYNLTSYPGVVKNTWVYFSQTITDSQYFDISNFRLRFDGSGLGTDSYIDDVLIQKN